MLRSHFMVFATVLVVLSSAAMAAPSPPWKIPESNFGGAKPLAGTQWLSIENYPIDAIRNGKEGFVTIAFTIGIDGRMTDCRVVRSSGYRDLDLIPCKVLSKRVLFEPALDEQGQPRNTSGTTSIVFWMPYE